ncbi:hypothetical protein [Pelomonas sp. Root1444]|uniref:hypothetical protein n=1 Tax=Pelomonas sp. Root1444 TaxID=1736464 RepID=UPI0012FBC30B|nr:hypothetical protein [Pelomonas sp. Root1444]
MPLPAELRFELRPRRPSRALLAALLIVLAVAAWLFAKWLIPQVEAYRRSQDLAANEPAVGPQLATSSASAAVRNATAVLDDRLHEAELCVRDSATLHRFTYDAAERVATMHITLREAEALGALMGCLNANITETEGWKLLGYEALDSTGAHRGVQRSSRIVLSSLQP